MNARNLAALFLLTVPGWGGELPVPATPATNAAPSEVAVPVADPGEEKAKAMQVRLVAVKKQVMADPGVKIYFKAAGDAGKRAGDVLTLKMKELDLTIAPLLDRSPKQPLAGLEKQKVSEVRARAMKDPQVKAAFEQSHRAAAQAREILNAKVKELDPELAPLVDAPSRKNPKPVVKPVAAATTNAAPSQPVAVSTNAVTSQPVTPASSAAKP